MKRFKENITYNRLFKMLITSIFLFLFLIGRLYWIQIINHESLKVQALKQRGKEIKLAPSRGIIYDRNLIPLTNRKKVITGFFLKENIENNPTFKKIIMENSDINSFELDKYIKSKGPIIDIPLTSDSLETSDEKVLIANKIERYDDTNTLSHVIGHINISENRGKAGIEKVYDEILRNKANESLYVELDEKGKKFINEEYLVSQDADSKDPSGVKLTIDYNIQKEVEEILDRARMNGAIIVADVETADILAMVSRPNFDQDDIDKYLNREDMALYNKAVQVGYPPGSLFKLVVLLTALEEDIKYSNNKFYCNGYEKIDNIIINCNNRKGHGHITLKEAFSKSCNSAFIQLGQELGSKKIIDMANRLGFGKRLNIGLLEEIEGNLPSGAELLGPSIGNISIGQGSIETTPLQITDMMLTIANNGIKKGMSIVEGITAQNGHIIKKFDRQKGIRLISENSCEIVQDYLVDVVKDGTARNLDLMDIGGAGGKTGSAEAILNGDKTAHGWFSGFYPEKDPKYVITIFIEEGFSGSQSAVPIFENIVRAVYNINW